MELTETSAATADDRESEEDEGTAVGRRLAGKFITFKLADEEYGVEILKVQELLRLMQITRVARAKDYIRGVINLRGKVIPVADLRVKFEMGRAGETDLSAIIVMQCGPPGGELVMGIFVDEVLEVLELSAKQIEPPPNYGAGSVGLDFVLGVGKVDHRVVFLLDIDRVLTRQDKYALTADMEAAE